ncbi:MAG: F0F1 ATP synthase subunit B [Rhodospirillaceae bacterium]|nr:F0F1 ATP synthase subunit B [Rhodospirillaceae bacterium]
MIGDFLREAHLLLAAGGEPGHHGTGTVAGWAKELFDIHGPTFWVAVAFVIFVAFMVWKARKALVGGLDARAVRIKAEIDEAQRLREEAQALLADYQKKQRDALNEAQAMLRQAEEEGQRLKAKAEAQLDAALKRREQQALDRIAQAEQHALAEVRNLAADLAVAATEKLLTEKLGTAQAEGMVSDAIADLPRRLQ